LDEVSVNDEEEEEEEVIKKIYLSILAYGFCFKEDDHL
jgi:hypothetical protein